VITHVPSGIMEMQLAELVSHVILYVLNAQMELMERVKLAKQVINW